MENQQSPAETQPTEPTSQFEIALQRIQQQQDPVDPQSAVAPFNASL